MPRMQGLTIIVATADAGRFHAALSLAAAQAALGGRARIYLHAEAVGLLKTQREQEGYRAAGLPDVAELRIEAAALGVRMIACQSGFALAGIDHADVAGEVVAGGLVSLLTALGDDRLVMV